MKQIDLDAMRALADNPHSWHCDDDNAGDCGMCERNDTLRAAADEIAQLRKERDALREALESITNFKPVLNDENPYQQIAVHSVRTARAALAAQGDKR